MELKVLNGNKEEIERRKLKRSKIYERLYFDYKYGFTKEIDNKKSIFWGVKYINKFKYNDAVLEDLLKVNCEIDDIIINMARLTYNEFIELFPIIKDYDGNKWECKDYYSTKEYLNKFDLNTKIGIDNIQELIFQYYNQDILNFGVYQMLIVDRISRYLGEKGILERFLDEVDPEHKIDTYTYNKEHNYIQNNRTGKITKVHKQRPDYLKVIK
jgi:hypothetical protein